MYLQFFSSIFILTFINFIVAICLSKRPKNFILAVGETYLVAADDEWSPLKAVIVGRAEDSAFPSEPIQMMENTMPLEHIANFKPSNPFRPKILAKAQQELDHFAALMMDMGIRVYRPKKVNWLKVGRYTGAMPWDGLMTVGSTLVGAPFAWRCRRQEITLAYSNILEDLSSSNSVQIRRAPLITRRDTLYDSTELTEAADTNSNDPQWTISNSRPAFDAADFMRFGKTIIGQLSHVTNPRGVEYLRSINPKGYTVEILKTTD